ncbi:hypothetical protein TARUN_9061 [Trichoderma arundinaceum]|uniref:Uncharacterized protein n=1 Tax=Trichoderma arundinaceum TaxID=490622 RepID=A0A395NAT3_TRIAR|nr:hypothetical protein TARUN_9061 [Trichoderma arundinaceum]
MYEADEAISTETAEKGRYNCATIEVSVFTLWQARSFRVKPDSGPNSRHIVDTALAANIQRHYSFCQSNRVTLHYQTIRNVRNNDKIQRWIACCSG